MDAEREISHLRYRHSLFQEVAAWCAVFLISASSSLAQYSPPRKVGSLHIQRVNVFDTLDPRDDNFIGTFVNSLHVVTRDRVIRRELLLNEGDPFSMPLLEESERNLRKLGFIADPVVSVDSLADGSVRINVRTQDKWTIGLGASY